jgi:hypothetical protein
MEMAQAESNTTPQKYRPAPRLVDQPEQLRHLYCERDLSVRDIATEHSEMSVERVYHALTEYGIVSDDADEQATTPPDQAAVWTD